MSHTFLLEVGLEEIPAHVVTPSARQLKERVETFLKDQRLVFNKIDTFSTPRRLAVKITGLADKQNDIEEEAKGPAKKIALDKDGNWSKAAIGFSRGQGMSPDDIFFKELKGTEYAYVKKFIVGKTAAEVLVGIKEAVTSMIFPTMMRWGNNDFKYVRPIRWLVALLDKQVIPFSVLNVQTNRVTQGHRFLGNEVVLESAEDYPQALVTQKVIADAAERKQMIKMQIEKLAAQNNWKIVVDSDLLEEVNNLVEFPTVFAGSFAEKYLDIPDEVLITSMKDHQRFFYVLDQSDNLLPNFVSVRNGNDEHLENVVAGNEKVLTARLEDAAFFYHEDQQKTIEDYANRLKKVMFHDKIGTVYEKMERVRSLCKLLAAALDKENKLSKSEEKALDRAAQIYKFDLVTGMVGEFSELQGVMGEKYALLMGELPEVATAIREHYLPNSSDGVLPESKVGALLAIADKIDSIGAFFASGMIPTGSNDPYALRRQALGIVRITLARNWNFSADSLQKIIVQNYENEPILYKNIKPTENYDEMGAFIVERVKKLLSESKFGFDVIETASGVSNNSFVEMREAANILKSHQNDNDFKENIEALTRVLHLAKKAPNDATQKIDTSLFENEAEKDLFEAVSKIKVSGAATNSLEQLYAALGSLRPLIDNYFEKTMIMVEDEKVRANRLAQLLELSKLTQRLGKLDKLNVK
ncbi:glycyl-tRNA synthetase subunit beta [Liquorilactobacillus aquaticus DSM 21051]|uniref:Glycine--tRNA ligase beta subunit n=1 Tax=Liquorilactobacillus aquaticus DSM 21051 TaxID=1423725 RepID=A0A0R2CWT7_9LACO|nr:glycine--tRNA ligase subunit beta [Liquorilactobacillus aquaticus]KRM96366.1 glycyl-tRNA synthetase subunit beta [Liquorilactobacillus aquaticus DSM 21051]